MQFPEILQFLWQKLILEKYSHAFLYFPYFKTRLLLAIEI